MHITIERMEEIELERNETMSDPAFQNWMSNLNVSQSYEDPEGKIKAREVQSQYDVKKYQKFFS
jgi:hypothetical protein